MNNICVFFIGGGLYIATYDSKFSLDPSKASPLVCATPSPALYSYVGCVSVHFCMEMIYTIINTLHLCSHDCSTCWLGVNGGYR